MQPSVLQSSCSCWSDRKKRRRKKREKKEVSWEEKSGRERESIEGEGDGRHTGRQV